MKVAFEPNSDVEEVKIRFHGDRIENRTIERLEEGSLESVEVNGTGYSNVYIRVGGCGKVFEYK